MYIVKGGFSTLKQIGGLVRNRCLTLDKTWGNLALRARGGEPSLLCYRNGIKPLTGKAVDKTELNFGSNTIYSHSR